MRDIQRGDERMETRAIPDAPNSMYECPDCGYSGDTPFHNCIKLSSSTQTPRTDACEDAAIEQYKLDCKRMNELAACSIMATTGFEKSRTLELSLLQAQRERERIVKESIPDGSWMDSWGACRVCGGEIPHGHTKNCDLYKKEQELIQLRNATDLLCERLEAHGRRTDMKLYQDVEQVLTLANNLPHRKKKV